MTSLTALFTVAFWLVLLGSKIVRATDADTCRSACTDWAVVMLYCRWEYADRFTTNQDDYIYNNRFVACLCKGQTGDTTALGNSTISASASTCSTCLMTPSLVVQNINVGVLASWGIPLRPETFVQLLIPPGRIFLTYVLSKLRMGQPKRQ
ncbi:hypothetical protein I352_01425 [Cryptococcus deuterogattii MMRL2647]|nr:hypothetical protein I352_01425 [Cryptococcus deuterogattii MMRL2647]